METEKRANDIQSKWKEIRTDQNHEKEIQKWRAWKEMKGHDREMKGTWKEDRKNMQETKEHEKKSANYKGIQGKLEEI